MKRRVKKIILFILIIIVSINAVGCWDSRELNALGIAVVIGFDVEGDKIKVTVEVIKPVPAQSGSEPSSSNVVKYVQSTGDSLFEAIRNVTLKFDRKIFLSHNKVFIFGEEFAKKGIIGHMDVVQRDHEFRESGHLVVAKGSRAEDVMGISSGIRDIPGEYIEDLIKNQPSMSKSVKINVNEFLKYYYDIGRQPVMGVIQKKDKKSMGKSNNKNKKEEELLYEGLAIFKKDRLIGFLDGDETKSFNFIEGEVKGGLIEFPTPMLYRSISSATKKVQNFESLVSPEVENLTVIEILRSRAKNDIEIQDGKVILKTKVDIKGMLGEETADIDTAEEEIISVLNKSCSNKVKKGIETTIEKIQHEYRVDIFGFGSLFHRKYPKDWAKVKNNWNEIFSKAEVQVEVEADIVRTGLINTPSSKVKGK
jgi:spore germination protein KC